MLRIGILLALVAAAPTSWADDRGLDYNLVSLSADAQVEVANDEASVLMTVEYQNADASRLPGMVNADMGWALRQAERVEAVQHETRQYSTRPQYQSGRIVGWSASQQLFLKSRDFDALTTLVTALQARLQVNSMDFSPSRETQLEAESGLTREAINAFTAKADLIADSLGAKDYEIVRLNINGQGRPMVNRARGIEMMAMAADAPPIAVEGGTAQLNVSVSGEIQLRY